MSGGRWSRGVAVVLSFADVFVAFAWVGLAITTTLLPAGSPVRTFAALTTLSLLPGYALTTAIYPASTSRGATRGRTSANDGWKTVLPSERASVAAISDVERAALSFGLSIASLPLIGLVAEVTYGSYDLVPVISVLTAFLGVAFLVGVHQRLQVPQKNRYVLPLGRWVSAVTAGVRKTEGLERVLNVGLALAVVASMAMVGVALVAPQEGEEYTEVGVLASQPDGDWAAKNYPTEIRSGETVPVMVTVSNREREPEEYTVVLLLQRIGEDGTVTEYRELNRFTERVEPAETWRNPHEVTPRLSGESLRLTYLVYRDDPPATPSRANAYRHVSFRVNVTA